MREAKAGEFNEQGIFRYYPELEEDKRER